MTGILGMLDLLLETELTAEQREFAEDSRLCAHSLLDIMNSTLEYSALSANQVTLEEGELALVQLLDSVLDEFSVKAAAKGLTFIRDLQANIPEAIVGDGVKLKKLFSNLLENAIKFTNFGEIEVSCSAVYARSSVLFTFSVRDTGIGIPEDKLESIFESFRQLEMGLDRRFTGMGLGLAVTEKLARLMNAEITVKTEVNHGSTFSIILPLKLSRESALIQPTRILLVGNNSLTRTIAVRILDHPPYQLDCATGPEEGLELAGRYRYDLILLDLHVPGLDTEALSSQLRALPGFVLVPVLALSPNQSSGEDLGEDPSEDLKELALGHWGLPNAMAKPMQSGEFMWTLEQFLHRTPRASSFPGHFSRIAV